MTERSPDEAPDTEGSSDAPARPARRRWLSWAIPLAVLSLAVAAGLLFAVRGQQPSPGGDSLPQGVSTPGGPVVLGSPTAATTVDLWEDFQCPACGDLERSAFGTKIAAAIDDGTVQAQFHMVAFLDKGAAGASSRAANAAFCASDQGRFLEFHSWAYAHQPQENGNGYTTEELIAYGPEIGIEDQSRYADCVTRGTYLAQVKASTESMVASNIQGTPTIFDNGKKIFGP